MEEVVTLGLNMTGQQQLPHQQLSVGGDNMGTTQDAQQRWHQQHQQQQQLNKMMKEDVVPVFVEADEEQHQLHNYHQDEEEQQLAAANSSPRRHHHHIMKRFVAVVPSGSGTCARTGAGARGASCNASSTVDLEDDDEEGEASLPYHQQRHVTSLDARIVMEDNGREYQRRLHKKESPESTNVQGGGGGGSMSNLGYNYNDPCSTMSNNNNSNSQNFNLNHHDSDDEEWKKNKFWMLVGIFGFCTMCLCLAISVPLFVMNGGGGNGRGSTSGTTSANHNNPAAIQIELARRFFTPYFLSIGEGRPGGMFGMEMDDDYYVNQQLEEEEDAHEDVLFFSNGTFVTPQYQALEWLVQYDTNKDTRYFIDELLPSLAKLEGEKDGGDLASKVDEQLSLMMIERLVVAILYFATGGPTYWSAPSISVIYELEYYDEYDNDSYNIISELFLSAASICEWNTVVGDDGDEEPSNFVSIGIGCDDKNSVISIYLGT